MRINRDNTKRNPYIKKKLANTKINNKQVTKAKTKKQK